MLRLRTTIFLQLNSNNVVYVPMSTCTLVVTAKYTFISRRKKLYSFSTVVELFSTCTLYYMGTKCWYSGSLLLLFTVHCRFNAYTYVHIKDAMSVSFRSVLFTSYILTIFKQWNLLSWIWVTTEYCYLFM